MAEPLRVLFLAHAFPRTVDDLTGGFLLRLASIPCHVWLRWRATRAPTRADPLTVEERLPPIADKQPVGR